MRLLVVGLCAIIISTSACGPSPSISSVPDYKLKAERYFADGRFDKAIKELQKVLEIDEKDGTTYRRIAECFEKLNLADSAILYYEGAIVFNPADRSAYERVADLYFGKDEPHEAMAWYDRAQEIGYLSSGGYTRLAIIFRNWNELDRAGTYYEFAITADSTNGEALFGLATVDLIDGDTTSALSSLTGAYEFGFRAKAAFVLGQIYANMKNYDSAIEWFDKCRNAPDIDPSLKDQAFQRRMEIIMKMKSGQE